MCYYTVFSISHSSLFEYFSINPLALILFLRPISHSFA
nr:MAG TPA: hypothetical protein [Caudoviricetes sp.]